MSSVKVKLVFRNICNEVFDNVMNCRMYALNEFRETSDAEIIVWICFRDVVFWLALDTV